MARLRQLEGKVATLTVINGALQKENNALREVHIANASSLSLLHVFG